MAKKKTSKATHNRTERRLQINDDLTSQALDKIDRLGYYVVLLGLVLTCLLVYATRDSFLGPFIINGLDAGGQVMDVFALGKWTVLLISSLLLLVLLVYKIMAYGYRIQASPANIPLALMAILVAVSCLACDYPSVALMGVPDIHFGTLPLLAILLIFFAILNLQPNSSLLHQLGIALAIISIVNIIIAFGYYLGVKWFLVPFIKYLVVPADISIAMDVKGNLQSTFNNPNYVSGLFGSLTTFFLALAATVNNRRQIVMFLGTALVSLATAIISLSTSGFATVLVIAPLLVVLFIVNKNEKAFRRSALAAALVITLAAGLIAGSNDPRIHGATSGWIDKFSQAFSRNSNEVENTPDTATPVANSKFLIELPEESGWDSSRIYLAQKTWKIVINRPLLGYGMDTLVYYFPTNSRETIKVLGFSRILTKPHNMYLQLAAGAGIPALLAFLALVFLYLFLATKRIIKDYRSSKEIPPLPAAILAFIMAFSVQGLVNDLTIGTALCFFVLLGIGFKMIDSSSNESASSG